MFKGLCTCYLLTCISVHVHVHATKCLMKADFKATCTCMQNCSYHMLELENGLLYKGLFSYVGRVTSLAKFVLACLGVRLDSNG